MYKYINPENKSLKELLEYGSELILEIIDMLPEEIEKNSTLISDGIETRDYEKIQRGVHSIKSNLRYFVEVTNPVIEFIQDFENRAKKKMEEAKNGGGVETHVDFTDDFSKMKEIIVEPVEEVFRYRQEIA